MWQRNGSRIQGDQLRAPGQPSQATSSQTVSQSSAQLSPGSDGHNEVTRLTRQAPTMELGDSFLSHIDEIASAKGSPMRTGGPRDSFLAECRASSDAEEAPMGSPHEADDAAPVHMTDSGLSDSLAPGAQPDETSSEEAPDDGDEEQEWYEDYDENDQEWHEGYDENDQEWHKGYDESDRVLSGPDDKPGKLCAAAEDYETDSERHQFLNTLAGEAGKASSAQDVPELNKTASSVVEDAAYSTTSFYATAKKKATHIDQNKFRAVVPHTKLQADFDSDSAEKKGAAPEGAGVSSTTRNNDHHEPADVGPAESDSPPRPPNTHIDYESEDGGDEKLNTASGEGCDDAAAPNSTLTQADETAKHAHATSSTEGLPADNTASGAPVTLGGKGEHVDNAVTQKKKKKKKKKKKTTVSNAATTLGEISRSKNAAASSHTDLPAAAKKRRNLRSNTAAMLAANTPTKPKQDEVTANHDPKETASSLLAGLKARAESKLMEFATGKEKPEHRESVLEKFQELGDILALTQSKDAQFTLITAKIRLTRLSDAAAKVKPGLSTEDQTNTYAPYLMKWISIAGKFLAHQGTALAGFFDQTRKSLALRDGEMTEVCIVAAFKMGMTDVMRDLIYEEAKL